MQAVNRSNSMVIASDLRKANGFLPKLRGLIGKTVFEKGEGLWMAPCRAIHTIGMRFPIDVVFMDKDFTVRKIVKCLRPFRPIVYCYRANGIMELPVGTIENANIQVGDKIEIVNPSE